MIKKFNDLLALIYLPFIFIWTVTMVLLVKFTSLSVMEAFGLGTASGVLLSILKDIFQFYYRKLPPGSGGSTL